MNRIATPTNPLFWPWHTLTSLWKQRELVWQFAQRDIQLRHKGSKLGFLWNLITPLSMLALYMFVFGLVFQSRFGVLPNETFYDFTLALFLGLSLFHIFSETLAAAPSLITANPNFVKKVVFPLEVLPVAKIVSISFHLGISLALVVLGSAFGSVGLSWSFLWLPVIALPMLMLALGVCWLLAAIGVFIRDIGHATAFTTTALLFASAVFYPSTRIQDGLPALWAILKWNPLLQIVEISREIVLWQQPVSWPRLVYVYAWGAIMMMVGHYLFTRLRPSFAEVI